MVVLPCLHSIPLSCLRGNHHTICPLDSILFSCAYVKGKVCAITIACFDKKESSHEKEKNLEFAVWKGKACFDKKESSHEKEKNFCVLCGGKAS